MKEDTIYYSYDGHYFYTNYENLVNDNKVNKDPYYNYYQYIPHRTTSYLNNSIYNAYLDQYGVSDESVLYNQADLFFKVQNKYSINATIMYALALNEVLDLVSMRLNIIIYLGMRQLMKIQIMRINIVH